MDITLRVRRRKINGNIYYRYFSGSVEWSKKEMKLCKSIVFIFSKSMSEKDKENVHRLFPPIDLLGH